ncbi:unnamed protein product [Phytophthora fragariaefolia]|uniref:Unnamed protein product n=1 Tax=Phytophthora fragariaefolia TaxID=1490495 RepID=A0A9W6UB19_9STRA|nr:unnamed protein product [Phytophthora fragariaefolia]
MLVAVLWQFPIPFGYIIMVGPYLVFLLSFTLIVVGRRSLAKSTILRDQIKSQAIIALAQGLVAMAYPFFTAVFYRLSGAQQIAVVIIMPGFKHITKHIIANAAMSIHEYVGSIVVFSVDVFNVFYVAMCMQSSKSVVTTLLIIASDSFHVVAALRDIFDHANVVQTRNQEHLSAVNYLEDVVLMVQTFFAVVDESPGDYDIRVRSPFPLLLDPESSIFLDNISRTIHDMTVMTSLKVATRVPISGPAIVSMKRMTDVNQFRQIARMTQQPSELRTKLRTRSLPESRHNHNFFQTEPPSIRLLTLMPSALSSNALNSCAAQSTAKQAVYNALQALFHSEYLLLTEYIECALPLLYAAYLTILFTFLWHPFILKLHHQPRRSWAMM